ncbi:MAG TPA: IPT/TIG domain-containing protein, partial [Candidatus Limnocylindria bacterium]|nr:IPT/TIG domain-containing protein [Candidatus Limnocylindria bacterium]
MRTRWFASLSTVVLTVTIALGGTVVPYQANAAGPVTLRSTSTLTPAAATNTYTIPTPAGVVANDVMVAALSLNGGGAVTAPTGWTLIRNTNKGSVRLWSYYRVAGASEPASYTWKSGQVVAGVAGIAAYIGVDPLNPLNGSSGATGSNNKATAPAVTLTAPSVALLLLTIDGTFSGSVTYPAGFTQRWALVNYERGYVADNLSIGTGTLPAATINLSANDAWSVQQVALRAIGSAPTVTSITPNSGLVAGGTAVTVTGTGFQTGATVSFGGSALTVSTVTATSITGTTTAHAAGTVNVVVTNPDAQTGACTGCFTYVAPGPTVSSVTPNSGPATGGTSVSVAGTGFQPGATVSFGGSALTVSTVTATSITGTTSAHAAALVNVVVTNPDSQSGTCAGCFTYIGPPPPPTVTSVTPNSGSTSGGTAVTIGGTGFQAGTTASFGGSALTVSTVSSTAITGTTTAHAAGAVAVTVTNPDSQTGSCAACFTYLAPGPTVTSVAPSGGSTLGGTSVTVTGT